MKKNLLLSLIALFTIIPMQLNAKTLEVNYPTNEVTRGQLLQLYDERVANFYDVGSSVGNTIVNPVTQVPIIGVDSTQTTIRFTRLQNITDDDLIFDIPQDMRDSSINQYGVDIYNDYDSVKFVLKEFTDSPRDEATLDFTQYNEIGDINRYDYYALTYLYQIANANNFPLAFNESYVGMGVDITEDFSEVLTNDDRSLVKMYGKQSNSPYKVKLADDATVNDNVTIDLPDSVQQELEARGIILKKVNFIFGKEVNSDENASANANANANNVNGKNPRTFNNLFLVLLITGISVIGAVVVIKMKKVRTI